MSNDFSLDLMLRHMAWANQHVFKVMADHPQMLSATTPHSGWTAAEILAHIAGAANGYATRLEAGPRDSRPDTPTTADDVHALAALLDGADKRLREFGAVGHESISFASYDGTQTHTMPKATILIQAIHHATEHRAHLADALSTNGHTLIDLDALDLWSFGDVEGTTTSQPA